MSKPLPLASLLPGAVAGALVATLILVFAPPGPGTAVSASSVEPFPQGNREFESEMLALLREIRDELQIQQARSPRPSSPSGALRPSGQGDGDSEPAAERSSRMPVGDGVDADLVAAMEELNASLREIPKLLPKSSLPPRGGSVPTNRLRLLELDEYMQLIETSIEIDEDRVDVWEEDYQQAHYGLSAADLHARFGPPDEFYTSDEKRSITWRYYHPLEPNGYVRMDFRLLDGVVVRASPRYRIPE